MSKNSKIEWTESTWNPITGCTKISAGCQHCYAEKLAIRLQAMGNKNYSRGFTITTHKQMFDVPLTWKKPQIIFVNSMSDFFHENIPNYIILELLSIMKKAYWHNFQILTKRAERLLDISNYFDWPENVWIGVTVENRDYLNRIDYLKACKSRMKFISFEPLIGPIGKIDLDNIDWVITGGESGPKSRKIEEKWVIEIRDQCISKSIPFFFKQWGGFNKKKNGRILEGITWSQIPKTLNLIPNSA